MMKRYPLAVSVKQVIARIQMLLEQFESPFKASDLYKIRRGVITTNKDESIDYEAAITYLDKTNQVRILEKKEPFDETVFEPTIDFGVSRPTLPVALPTAAKGKIASDAGMMLEAYAALYVLENTLRDFIEERLKQSFQSDWWQKGIPAAVNKKVVQRKADIRTRWHHIAVGSPLMMTDFNDLAGIISVNWVAFKETMGDLERVKSVLAELEVPRNIVAHCNPLAPDEKTRLLQNVRIVMKLSGR